MHRYVAAIIVLALTVPAQADWSCISECPVVLEHLVYVPALESGIVSTITIDQNAEVVENQTLGTLDDHDVKRQLESARLIYQHAYSLAKDASSVRVAKSVLADCNEQLRSSREIKESVSKSEMRKREIDAERAEASLLQAENLLARAIVDANIKADAYSTIEQKLKRHTIAAPCAGIVFQIETKRGQWVEQGKPILAIAKMDTLLVNCFVDELTAAQIVGKPARVSIDGQYIDGEVASQDIQVTDRGEVRVHARMINKRNAQGHWMLRPGKTVTLEIYTIAH